MQISDTTVVLKPECMPVKSAPNTLIGNVSYDNGEPLAAETTESRVIGQCCLSLAPDTAAPFPTVNCCPRAYELGVVRPARLHGSSRLEHDCAIRPTWRTLVSLDDARSQHYFQADACALQTAVHQL